VFKQRVIEEKNQLDLRIANELRYLLGHDDELLELQVEIMKEYSNILNERLLYFEV
jgi:hypothetical protein